MANVTYNAINSASGSPGNFDASVVWSAGATYTGNFQRITNQLNGGLDADNYSVSGFVSTHFAHNAIVSQHISNNAIISDKLTDEAIVEAHMNYQSSDGGARILRCKKAGLKRARLTQTQEIAASATGSQTLVFMFSDAEDGDPGFTATPTVGALVANAGASEVQDQRYYALDNVSCAYAYNWFDHIGTNTYTFHIQVEGF